MKYKFYYCQRCGSTDVSVMTVQWWDQTEQVWVSEQPDLESGFCRPCLESTQIREGFIVEKLGDE